MFQQPLHASTSRQPPHSAPTINRTWSAPTTHNQIHRVSQPSCQPSQPSQPLNPRAPPEALGLARWIAGNQRPNALDLPEGLSSARRMAGDTPQRQTVSRACSNQAPFSQTNHLQARRQSRHVRFDIASETSASASTPSSGRISEAPPLRVWSAPLPPVTTVLVESETESDSLLLPEVRNCFVDLIMMIGLLPGSQKQTSWQSCQLDHITGISWGPV